jgi:hypothetical protein
MTAMSMPANSFMVVLKSSTILCPSPAPLAASAATPAAAPAAATANEPDDEKEHDSAQGGVDDRGDKSETKMDTELRHQPVADEGADNSDDHVADEPKAGPLHDLTGQPPGSKTNQQYYQETFSR